MADDPNDKIWEHSESLPYAKTIPLNLHIDLPELFSWINIFKHTLTRKTIISYMLIKGGTFVTYFLADPICGHDIL